MSVFDLTVPFSFKAMDGLVLHREQLRSKENS